jgi:hypothetical protein
MLRFVVLAALVGCTSQTAVLHARSISQLPDPREVLLGDDIVVDGAAETCGKEWVDGHDDPKNIFAGLPERRTRCHSVDAELQLSCSGPCSIHNGRITPAQPGPFDVIAALRSGDRVLATRATSYLVVVPERIGLECGTSEVPAPCDGVPASVPFVRPFVIVRGHMTTAPGVTLNGHPAKRYNATSLAELFPDRSTDGRLEPGLYTVDVGLGATRMRHDIVVR